MFSLRHALATTAALSVAASVVVVTGAASAAPSWAAWASSPIDVEIRLTPVAGSASAPTVSTAIDPNLTFQTWRGVGAALTDSSVELLDADSVKLLFDPTAEDGAQLNLLRLPLSATDFSTETWTWSWDAKRRNATPPAQALAAVDAVTDITAIRSDLEVMATSWTAPAELKSNRDEVGG